MENSPIRERLEKLLGYLEQDASNLALLSEASDLSLQAGDWSQARQLVERALALQPQDPVTRYRMAIVLLNERKHEESLAITQSLIDAGHTHPAVLFEHARGLAMAGRFEEAEPVFVSLLPAAASFAELPYLYIRTLHHLGKVEEAISFAQAHLASRPDDGIAQGMLGLLYLDNDDIAQAATLSAQALERAPSNLDGLITAGSAALAYEREDEAKAHFDKALALHATSGRAWAGLGLARMLNMELPEARHAFEEAVRFMPDHLGSYGALSWIQILQRDHVAARKTLEAALAIDRTFGETHGGLAVLAALEGEWDEATKLADTAVRLQPDSFSGRFAKSLITAHRGRPERAREMVEMMFDTADVPAGGNLREAVHRFARKKQKQ